MFKCFKKPQQESIGYDESDVTLEGYRWGYIVPHNRIGQGASAPETIIGPGTEYIYGLAVVFPRKAKRDVGGVKGACKTLKDNFGVDASFEDHKNAYNRKTGGAEILVLHGDTLSEEIAERILEAFCAKFGRKNRGVKKIRRGGRGYNNLKTAKKYFKVALLGELFFIDNHREYINHKEYSAFLNEVLK